MSKHIEIDDIKNALLDLNRKIFLKKSTAEYILKTIADLPTIDIVYCEECKYREKCEQIVVFDIGENQIEGRKIDYCSYGERKDNE